MAASAALAAAPPARSVVYELRHPYGVPTHVVTVNLNDPRIRVSVNTARGGIGHSERLSSMVHRLMPAAAITGTFFDNATLLPVGDIVAGGKQIYRGPAGTGFAVRADNSVTFQPRNWGRTYDWSDFETVLCTGPTLLRGGGNALFPIAEGYKDPSLWALRPRTAVGLTRHNKLLLVSVNRPIHLRNMRNILSKMGAVEAVGLDGGSSSGLYAGGAIRVRPGRSLTNVLTVYRVKQPSMYVVQRLETERDTRLAALLKLAPPAKTALADTLASTLAVLAPR
jgi:exopolysaccharide biosynthesis protein